MKERTRRRSATAVVLCLILSFCAAARSGENTAEGRPSGAGSSVNNASSMEATIDFHQKLGSASAHLKRSTILLPEDQERDIKQRQEEIARLFSALEIRREMERLEEEAFYKAQKEAELLEKRRMHVSTANFGHTYNRTFSYRGGSRRQDRLASGMGVGEYYGGLWKQVSADAVLSKAMTGRYPSRARRYQALTGEKPLGQQVRDNWLKQHAIRGPNGLPIYGRL